MSRIELMQQIENRVHETTEVELQFNENSIAFHRCEGTINGLLQVYELLDAAKNEEILKGK